MKQVYNPYLPLNEYIPDGEVHVFGDRVYVYGSHDREAGYTFCMDDYVTYSAPVNNLKDWRYEGVIYKACQDPQYDEKKYMYAPDVVRGNDGKFYLYYCMAGDYGCGGYTGPIGVAVADSPAGKFEFLDFIHYKDGSVMKKYICFDPGVINDNGVIRIYYGTQYGFEEEDDFAENESYINSEIDMFGRTKEEILSYEDSIMGPVMLVLEDDMVTVKEDAKHIIPYKVKGTAFENHSFFEASSIRKVGEKYYFIYSSCNNHELCYAVSDFSDKDFVYGGTIVSNGDVGFNGRRTENRLNMTGTTHGCIENINGEWYVFYHRLTHKSDYSRQSCAEKIKIETDGSIKQVEITSCGLNGGPLSTPGSYPAIISCNLTQGNMPHGTNSVYNIEFPNITNLGEERFIAEIENETLIGYKYFDFKDVSVIKVKVRFETINNKVIFKGPVRSDERCIADEKMIKNYMHNKKKFSGEKPYFEIRTKEDGCEIARIFLNNDVSKSEMEWQEFSTKLSIENQISALYFIYHGNDKLQFIEFEIL